MERLIMSDVDLGNCSRAELTEMYLKSEITAVCYYNYTGVSPPIKNPTEEVRKPQENRK